jgi:hypothetical protein
MTTQTIPASKKSVTHKKEKTITLTETQEILADPETMAALRKGAQETKAGKHISLEQMKRELGL